MEVFGKDPSAELDYSVDWVTWLAGDTIANSSWTVSATSLVIITDVNTTTSATVWLSGGVAGKRYLVTNTIITVGGRTDQRTLIINGTDK